MGEYTQMYMKMKASTNSPRLIVLLAAGLLAGTLRDGAAAVLIAHWPFNEGSPPYADAEGGGIDLVQDAGTTTAIPGMGIEGQSALLHVDTPPVSTRLAANDAALQRDSFGFSFWINPVSLNEFDTFLAKEMGFDNSVPNDERMAWQVHILDDNGSSAAAVEFLVRGDDRTQANFYGAAVSGVTVPLFSASTDWIHIAGGYNANSGQLSLYVNGEETLVDGSPGAGNSDGSPLAVGTTRNGTDVVAFAASTYIEDIQIYDRPLAAAEVAFLGDNPGESVGDVAVVDCGVVPGGDGTALTFECTAGANYLIEVSTNLPTFAALLPYESSVNLVHDAGTAGPWDGPGKHGSAALLRWDASPGVATREFANNPVLQTDSFGFSFWIKPENLNPWDNLIAKEMAFDNSVPDWNRIAWQVHLMDNNGSGSAAVELVVRGDDRAAGDFYGFAQSAATLPLYTASADWYHLAGGYDAESGALRLYVNGQETVSGNSSPGAMNSDGSPLAVGTARNGSDVVQYAAVTWIDDLQIYDRPLSESQVAYLMAWPGDTISYNPNLTAHWRFSETGNFFRDAGQGRGLSSVLVSPAVLDGALGPGPHPVTFFRVIEIPPLLGFQTCE